MSKRQPIVSVVIPTYNSSKKLFNLITSLENQTFKNFEAIVVNDGSTDDTAWTLEQKKFSLEFFKIIHQDNKGHAIARNHGVKNAGGELIIFFDSDVRPYPDCIENHVKYHRVHNDSILTGRAVMDSSIFLESDFCQYRYYLESKIWSTPSKNGFAKVTPENYFFSTQNLSLPRKLFIDLGKFDESLKDSVDFDLCVRAMIKNVPIRYNNKIGVWHDDQGTIDEYINRQIEYNKAREWLRKIKPHYVKIIPSQFSSRKNNIIRKFIKKLFIYNKFWREVTYSRIFKQLMPKWIRFKIYGYLIHSSSVM